MTKTVAEIVLDEGLIDRRSLDRAARHADEHDLPLVVSLVRESGIDEVALLAAIRKQVRVTVVEPGAVAFDLDALREVPREVCERRRVLPLSLRVYGAGPRVLQLAMADPTDAVAIAEVEHLSGCRVDPALMTLSAIEQLTDEGYRGFVTKVMRRGGAYGHGAGPAAAAAPEAGEAVAAPPSTTPFHRVADEADARARIDALVQLLVDRQVIGREEYDEAVRRLMKGRREGA